MRRQADTVRSKPSTRAPPAGSWVRGRAKWTLIITAALVGLLNTAAADPQSLPAEPYMVDPSRSSLTAVTGVLGGQNNVRLRFTVLAGRVAYAPSDPQRSAIEIQVDARSVQAAGPMATRAAAAALDAERYPTIRFVSRELDLGPGETADVDGDLSLRGITRNVVFTVSRVDPSIGAGDVRLLGGGAIRRSDFGVPAPAPFARDRIELHFDLIFVPQPGA